MARHLRDYAAIDGWLTPTEAYGLYKIAGKLKPGAAVVEIGSWKGKSTLCLARGLKSGVLHCIDPFNAAGEAESQVIYESTKGEESLLAQFQRNVKNIPDSVTVQVHCGYSDAFVGQIPAIDSLFIDGDHSVEGCRFDYENYAPFIASNGFLAFHDYYPDQKAFGPTWVIDQLVKKNQAFVFYRTFDSLQVFRKQA